MNIWKPRYKAFNVVCDVPGEAPRLVAGFDNRKEAILRVFELNAATNSQPYKLQRG